MSIGGLTSDQHQENSCEVYQKGAKHRTIVYGQTRDEVIAQLAKTFKDGSAGDDWMDDFVVTATKRVKMGFDPARTQVTRRSREYY